MLAARRLTPDMYHNRAVGFAFARDSSSIPDTSGSIMIGIKSSCAIRYSATTTVSYKHTSETPPKMPNAANQNPSANPKLLILHSGTAIGVEWKEI